MNDSTLRAIHTNAELFPLGGGLERLSEGGLVVRQAITKAAAGKLRAGIEAGGVNRNSRNTDHYKGVNL